MLPKEEDVRREGFIPAASFPSDHLYLLARFAFPPRDETTTGKRFRAEKAAETMLTEE